MSRKKKKTQAPVQRLYKLTLNNETRHRVIRLTNGKVLKPTPLRQEMGGTRALHQLCSDTVIHAYEHPILALLFDHKHGRYLTESTVVWWLMEGQVVVRDGTKAGSTEMKALWPIVYPYKLSKRFLWSLMLECVARCVVPALKQEVRQLRSRRRKVRFSKASRLLQGSSADKQCRRRNAPDSLWDNVKCCLIRPVDEVDEGWLRAAARDAVMRLYQQYYHQSLKKAGLDPYLVRPDHAACTHGWARMFSSVVRAAEEAIA